MTKILFIGLAESSHTVSWINLLEDTKFEFRLFALPTGAKPNSEKIPVYLSAHRFFFNLKNFNVKRISSTARARSFFLFAGYGFFKIFVRLNKKLFKTEGFRHFEDYSYISPSLISVIKRFRPDIVHTLGIFDSSLVFQNVRDKFPKITWIVQVRGGPDLDYFYLDESKKTSIKQILVGADCIICDSNFNYDLAKKLGASRSQFKLGVVSGTGGVSVNSTKILKKLQPVPIVIWPKAHEGISSKALPVLEGIKLAWPKIEKVRFEIFCLDQEEVKFWIKKNIPSEIANSFRIYGRINREEFLHHLSKAQVLLSPSLMDGVPNVLLESMANKVVPIVSPLETIKEFVSDPENVYFARNLFPNEIAEAIIKSLSPKSDNKIKIQNNMGLIKKHYERNLVRNKVIKLYGKI
jgi:glycosyltransferase involved in cell wall biosynthesis